MAAIKELIKEEANGSLSFGDYTRAEKAKVEDFKHAGDLYKVKTFATMTKLEKNGQFLYESVPGTGVTEFVEDEKGVSFKVESNQDAQITVGMEEDTEYSVFVGGKSIGVLKSNPSGKINISVELADAGEVEVNIRK
ncbi:MAG: endosialidase [Lachnospiraceae bacterium]|nr:endosialidase [Lachnospiraceae bacterium]